MPENENACNLIDINAEPEKEVTQPGMTKFVSAEEANAERSICLNFERESNVSDTNDSHWKKHDSQITSTAAGR
jgi:hypothetical protein